MFLLLLTTSTSTCQQDSRNHVQAISGRPVHEFFMGVGGMPSNNQARPDRSPKQDGLCSLSLYLQGSAIRRAPSCVNAAGKARQKW